MHLRWAERAVTPFSRLEMVQKWRQITDKKERETGSNRRRPAWEIGCQLNLKNNGVYGVHF